MNTDKYKWHILNSLNKTETGVPEFSKKYNITEELAKILMNRGIDDESKLPYGSGQRFSNLYLHRSFTPT